MWESVICCLASVFTINTCLVWSLGCIYESNKTIRCEDKKSQILNLKMYVFMQFGLKMRRFIQRPLAVMKT